MPEVVLKLSLDELMQNFHGRGILRAVICNSFELCEPRTFVIINCLDLTELPKIFSFHYGLAD